METIKIKTQLEIENYRKLQKTDPSHILNLDFREWKGGDCDMGRLVVGGCRMDDMVFDGDLDQRESTFNGFLDQSKSTFNGNLNQYGSTFKEDLDQRECTFGGAVKRTPPTEVELEFLRNFPINLLKMDSWQSDEEWKKSRTTEELHTCGTTFCIRGYAEAEYLVKNGREVEDIQALLPNLKYLFFLSNKQVLAEIERLLKN